VDRGGALHWVAEGGSHGSLGLHSNPSERDGGDEGRNRGLYFGFAELGPFQFQVGRRAMQGRTDDGTD
jgi:hypothetical protein